MDRHTKKMESTRYMKKKRKVLFGILVVVLIFMMLAVCVVKLVQHNYSMAITTPYTYPVVPGTEAWRQLDGHVEMLEACQIPEDILESLTTQALVETVLNYPLLIDMLAYNTTEAGYEAVYRNFNGLQELQERKDAIVCLEAYLKQMEQQMDSMEENDKVLIPLYVEVIISGISENIK